MVRLLFCATVVTQAWKATCLPSPSITPLFESLRSAVRAAGESSVGADFLVLYAVTMAKGLSGAPSGKRKSSSKPAASVPASQAGAASAAPETTKGLKRYCIVTVNQQASLGSTNFSAWACSPRYEVPADFQEDSAPLTMQTDLLDLDTELWLFQLPHEVSTGPNAKALDTVCSNMTTEYVSHACSWIQQHH